MRQPSDTLLNRAKKIWPLAWDRPWHPLIGGGKEHDFYIDSRCSVTFKIELLGLEGGDGIYRVGMCPTCQNFYFFGPL